MAIDTGFEHLLPMFERHRRIPRIKIPDSCEETGGIPRNGLSKSELMPLFFVGTKDRLEAPTAASESRCVVWVLMEV